MYCSLKLIRYFPRSSQGCVEGRRRDNNKPPTTKTTLAALQVKFEKGVVIDLSPRFVFVDGFLILARRFVRDTCARPLLNIAIYIRASVP